MKKLLGIVVLGLLLGSSVNAKQIYLECKRSVKEKENVTRVSITEYIFDKRKVTLKTVMADSYYEIKQIDGSITKQQQMFFPMTNIDKLPMTKIDEDDTFYYLGGQLFGYQEKTYDEIKTNLNLQRFKGLGEMNPDELWNTTLNPETRNLLQVQYSKDIKKDTSIIHTLMGNDVALRKDFIVSNAINVSNLDV